MQLPPGPIPKRSEERIRRNKVEVPVEKVVAEGEVIIPELNLRDCHPIVWDLYDAMKASAQSKFFEPSDWQYARLQLHLLNRELTKAYASAQMIGIINAALGELLVSEGIRRRLRLETSRAQPGAELPADVVPISRQLGRQLGRTS